MEIFSLKKIAEIIAKLDGRETTTLHAQLRNPLVKTLLQSVANDRGRGSAAKFEPRELIRARLLLGLIDIGLTSKDLASINAELNDNNTKMVGTIAGEVTSPESAKINKTIQYKNNCLDTLIRGAKAGEDWDIRIRFTRTPSGERRVSPWLKWSNWEEDSVASQIKDKQSGETHLGTLTVPASDLIRPLVVAVEAAAGSTGTVKLRIASF